MPAKTATGKYFNELMGHSLDELKERGTAMEGFIKLMKYPIDLISERFGEMTMDEKPVVMVDWPGESAVGEIMDALNSPKKVTCGNHPISDQSPV